MKKSIVLLAVAALTASCGKKTLFCQEKMFYHDKDIANGRTGTDTKRVEYDFTIGESAMDSKTGEITKYTKEYIEQKKAELEGSGRFDCEWKSNWS